MESTLTSILYYQKTYKWDVEGINDEYDPIKNPTKKMFPIQKENENDDDDDNYENCDDYVDDDLCISI